VEKGFVMRGKKCDARADSQNGKDANPGIERQGKRNHERNHLKGKGKSEKLEQGRGVGRVRRIERKGLRREGTSRKAIAECAVGEEKVRETLAPGPWRNEHVAKAKRKLRKKDIWEMKLRFNRS